MKADQLHNLDPFPVMGEGLTAENSIKLDFSSSNKELQTQDLKNTEKFNEYVFSQLGNKKYGFGGYLENRIIYLRSDHFQHGDPRCMHLGVDVWAESFHSIYCPLEAKVHSFQNNDNYGDYGPTIILEHTVNETSFYTLYGHLSVESLATMKVGKHLNKGEKFCEIGPFPENGDWPPHLHFQLIADLEGRKGDFPGVCAPSELKHYKEICLDPSSFIH